MDNTTNQNEIIENNKPTVIRDGSLKASIFENISEDGKSYYTTKLAKTYTDQNGNPRDTQNFSQSELLRVAELGREAYGRINTLKREPSISQARSQDQSQTASKQQSSEDFKQSRRQNNGPNEQRKQQHSQ